MADELIVVDTHVHPISKDTEKYPLRRQAAPAGGGGTPGGGSGEPVTNPGVPRRAGEGGMVEKGMDTEEMLAAMAKAGVRKTVLVQSASLYGFDNSYIADSAAKHPESCVSLCAIDVLADDAPDKLSYWVKERGMRGIRLTQAEELDNPKTYPVWERARELGIPIDVQIRPSQFEKLGRALEVFTDVPVMIDHAGNANRHAPDGTPAPAEPPESLLALSKYPNLCVKLTSQNVDGVLEIEAPGEAFFGPILRRFGANRLLWGTDFPATANQEYRERFEQSYKTLSFMSDEQLRAVLGGNALRLWPELAG
jgi:predicted TIM-barrel fold metal-dependent hydrolase